MVILRESYVNIHFLIDLSTDQLILESRDKAVGTDGQIIILTFAAFESNTVNKAFEIQLDHIAALNCTIIYVDGTGILFLLFFKFSLDLVIAYGYVSLLNLYAFVLTKSNFRLNSYGCSEDERFAGFDLYDIDLRAGNDLQFALFGCIMISHRHNTVGSILIEDTCAIHFLNHFTRSFTFSESRKSDFSSLFQVSRLDSFFKFFSGHFDGQLRHVLF